MIEIKGEYNTAQVFIDSIEDSAIEQIQELCNQEFAKDSKIRIMPDAHAGKGCVIGTTMTIKDKIVPNLVGVDIGCGMLVTVIPAKNKIAQEIPDNLKQIDKMIHRNIPAGRDIRRHAHEYAEKFDFSDLNFKNFKEYDVKRSIGTLGGGNHFYEIDKDDEGNIYFVIHSGSRNIGKKVAEYYQDIACKQQAGKNIPNELMYLEGDNFWNYIRDVNIMQQFASINRQAIMDTIMRCLHMPSKTFETFETIHNYIDTKNMILRKGAVSANAGEKFIVPINMRDGSLICEGLGNEDWNYSSPHGAGRVMSRGQAFKNISMEDYKQSMEGIYSSTVTEGTKDESPFAYKTMEDIINNISPTAKILKAIKPIYNFKSPEPFHKQRGREKR